MSVRTLDRGQEIIWDLCRRARNYTSDMVEESADEIRADIHTQPWRLFRFAL